MEGRGAGAKCNSFAASDAESEIVRLRKELAAADAAHKHASAASLAQHDAVVKAMQKQLREVGVRGWIELHSVKCAHARDA